MATYGIDLGTTYSCIAYVDGTGRPVVLKSAVGEDTTPSVVYFESPDNVVVGRQAKDSAVLAPQLVVELVKRQMGEDVHYSFHGQDHTPESISALILRELAHAAEQQTGEEVRDVVITVPAYFGLLEREATRKAGQIAGLNVLDVLAEPVAAALNYQVLDNQDQPGVRHIFIYDLGGGTFDTTVIRIDGDDIQVICTDGNHHLGGADWDSTIIDYLLRGFTEQYPQLDPGGDEQFMQDLATSAEQLKKALSATRARKHNVRFDGSVVQLELTREHLDELTSELLERTMEITERTIATAREKGVERFDDVLLVGGMTITPSIAQTLKERFGLDARLQDPHLAVAKGAALFALMKKVKVSMAGDEADVGPGAAQEVADQLGISVEQVENMAAKHVATVVPARLRAQGRRRQGPHIQDRPQPGPRVHFAPAHGEHPAARRHRSADLPHRHRQPARGQAGGVGAGRIDRLGRARAQHPHRRGDPRRPAAAARRGALPGGLPHDGNRAAQGARLGGRLRAGSPLRDPDRRPRTKRRCRRLPRRWPATR